MKETQKTKEMQIWEKINEPKVEEIIAIHDKNGKHGYMFIVNRVPKITRQRRKNKKRK
jgi:hypothetical protein